MKLLFLFFSCFCFLCLSRAQDTTQVSCVFYAGAENRMDCLFGSAEPPPVHLYTNNGNISVSRGRLIYQPAYTGYSFLSWDGLVFGFEVESIPDPDYFFAGHIGADSIAYRELLYGVRMVPVLLNIPVTVYSEVKMLSWGIYNRKMKEVYAYSSEQNFVKLPGDYKKAAWFILTSARVGLSDGSTRELKYPKVFRITRTAK